MLQIVLVEPEIPPNTGNIARLCAATGTFLHLVEPLGFELSDKTLKRAGMDYWAHVQWKTWPSFENLRAAHPAGRFHLFTTKTKKSYWDARFQDGDFLVFGRETKGLPEALLAQYPTDCLGVPMPNPHIRSLNLATTAGIALYEALRQTSKPPSLS
jgi:tRNA (cytidine/uridine-2'-O-)-methyltransferase